ncbi:MAG: hypothetical protein WAM78_02995 [Candidatus Sulfotelmatobacter sp.]
MEAVPKELAELDTCASLYLREISEPRQNSLRLLIEEAEVMPEEVAIRIAGTDLGTGHLVRSTASSRLFEIVWDNYVAYLVTNESYAMPSESEKFSGRLARHYSTSPFLDHISHATVACNEYPGPLRHIGIVSECHIIDVVSTGLPRITHMRPRPALQ